MPPRDTHSAVLVMCMERQCDIRLRVRELRVLQVLERECDPEVLPKKRAKLEGKRAKAYPKVGLRVLVIFLSTFSRG